MAVLLVVAVLIYRGAGDSSSVYGFLGLLATIALFRYHVTSPLDLSF